MSAIRYGIECEPAGRLIGMGLIRVIGVPNGK
jgi:hypothetical protein